jgi:hypothetical protein
LVVGPAARFGQTGFGLCDREISLRGWRGVSFPVDRRKIEDRRPKTEDRRPKTEDGKEKKRKEKTRK